MPAEIDRLRVQLAHAHDDLEEAHKAQDAAERELLEVRAQLEARAKEEQ